MAKKPTPAQTAEWVLAIRAGARYLDAAKAAGVDPDVAKAMWAEPEWRAQVVQAKASFETDALQTIKDAGKTDWKAAAWGLERVKKDRYGKQDTQEVNINVTALPFKSVVTGEVFGLPAETGAEALPDKVADAVVTQSKKAKS